MVVDWAEHQAEIKKHGLDVKDITHVLLTHLHQDHVQNLASYPKGTEVYFYGSSSILGSSEYGGHKYTQGFILIPELTHKEFLGVHSQKDCIYIIDSENEGKVAFVGDLAFSLLDKMKQDKQKELDKSISVNPGKRIEVIKKFVASHPEIVGYYLGHYYKKVSRQEMQDFLSEWK